MAMSREEMQALIDESRNKIAEEKQVIDRGIKTAQENPKIPESTVVDALPQPENKDQSVLDYVTEEGKTLGMSAIGAAELFTEFGTGMVGAFVGTGVGAIGEYLDNDTLSKNGEFFMKSFQDYTEAMTYQPRSVQGQQLSKWAQEVFGQFADWGDQAGDATFEFSKMKGTPFENTGSPMLATAVETAIAGAPVYVPFVTGKMNAVRKANKEALARREEIINAAKDNTEIPLDVAANKDGISQAALNKGNERIRKRQEINLDMNVVSKETAAGVEGMQRLIDKVTPDTQKINNVKEQKKLDKLKKELKKQEANTKQADLPLEEFPIKKGKPVEPHKDAGSKLTDADSVTRAKGVKAIQQASLEAASARKWPSWKQVRDKLLETTVDSSAGLRRRILQGLDKEQNRSLELVYNRLAGSTPQAQMAFQRYEAKITNGMQGFSALFKSEKDGFTMENFNRVADSMRVIQIAAIAKEKNMMPPRNSGGKTAVDHIHALAEMRKEVGDKVFNKLQNRVGELHKTYSGLLGDLYVAGLLSKQRYYAAKDSIYSPRQFLETIDPKTDSSLSITEYQFNPFSKKVKVNDSGLKELSKGDIALMELDQMKLLQEYTVRVTNNIWRNKANVELLDWVKKNPDNGWARVAKDGEKVNRNKGQIDAWIDGKKTTIIMDKPLALQWVGNTYIMGHGLSNFMRTFSGQFFMKPLTTGMNPEFALKLFPVDLVHAYFATDVFNSSAPIYTLQMGKQLSRTMKDAFFKGDRFRDAIDQGMGMNFLTHQGTDVFGGRGVIRNNTIWRKTKEGLSFLNEGMEVWVRLAIREQAMDVMKAKNLKKYGTETLTPEQLKEATGIAREQMDFSRGGTVTKALDTAFPYLNATTVAFSSTLRAAVKGSPKEKILGVNKKFAYKVMEMSTIAAGWAMYQELNYPEVMNSIPSDTKAKFWIIPTGRSYRDNSGNVRHAYFQIRKDNLVAGMTNPAEMAMRNYITGDKPEDQTLAYFKAFSPVIPVELSTPFGSAMHTYSYNHDFWGNPIWNNPELDVELADGQGFQDTSLDRVATSLFWKDVGQALNMNPMLLEKSFQNVAPDNSYLFGFGLAYKYLVKQMDSPADAENSFEQQLRETPFLRHHMKLTHPATKFMQDSLKPRTRSQIIRKIQRDNIDQLMADKVAEPLIEQWIKQQPVLDQERLFNSYNTKKELRKVFNGQEMSLNIPGPFFWNFVASEIKDPKEKAEVLYWEWRDMPTNEDRAKFMQIANRLSVDIRIWPSSTLAEFRRLQSDAAYGTSFFSDTQHDWYRNKGKRAYMDELEKEKELQHLENIQEQYRKFDAVEKQNQDLIDQGMLPDPRQ